MELGKFFTGLPPSARLGAMVCVAVLGFVFLSNHQVVDSLLNLCKAFPMVVLIPIHVGKGQPGEQKAIPLTQEKSPI